MRNHEFFWEVLIWVQSNFLKFCSSNIKSQLQNDIYETQKAYRYLLPLDLFGLLNFQSELIEYEQRADVVEVSFQLILVVFFWQICAADENKLD